MMMLCTIDGCGEPLTEPWRSRGYGWLCEMHYRSGVTGEFPIAQITPNSSPLIEFLEQESSKTVTAMALPRELLYRREFMDEWRVPETNPGPCQACGASVDDRVTYLPTGDQPKHYCFQCAESRSWEQRTGHGMDRGKPQRCSECNADQRYGHRAGCPEESDPKPPTLREWLGDRVSELGRWAEVLREHPVPAGLFLRFEWTGREWRGFARRGSNAIARADVLASIGAREETAPEAWLEAVQMALFTRHPDVKPEPARLRTWFGNEDI